ncbi:MAG: MBL fold metallo-hydrolase [Bacteroidales bacterium]|nr:MBL fold metallo-hydrolase [Bacteroidales bacterium]
MKVSRFCFNMFGVNTYILWDDNSKEAIIVDPGMIDDNECDSLDRFIASNNLNPIHLINTHMHIDHSFGITHISQKYGLKPECNSADQFLAERLREQARMFGLHISIDDLKIDVNLKDGDKLLLGDEEIHILQVPGHSPGSIVIYAPESAFVISGDVLFNSSIGRTDLPGGNYKQLIDTINLKLLSLPDDTIVYPGHGPETTIGNEKLNNPYL